MTELTGRALDAAVWKARGNEVFTQEQMLSEARKVWEVQRACRVFLMGFAAMYTQSGWIFEQTNIPCYSTDIAAAWMVVEEIQRRFPGWRFGLLGGDESWGWKPGKRGAEDATVDKSRREVFGWRASFFGEQDPTQNYGQRHADEWGETPCIAIARAALSVLSQEGR